MRPARWERRWPIHLRQREDRVLFKFFSLFELQKNRHTHTENTQANCQCSGSSADQDKKQIQFNKHLFIISNWIRDKPACLARLIYAAKKTAAMKAVLLKGDRMEDANFSVCAKSFRSSNRCRRTKLYQNHKPISFLRSCARDSSFLRRCNDAVNEAPLSSLAPAFWCLSFRSSKHHIMWNCESNS